MKCSCRFSGKINAMEIGNFRVVSKTFAGNRFSRNEAFLRNAGEWVEWDVKTSLSFEIDFKAELTSKV